MRIGLDLRPLQKTSRYRGIGSYLSNLVIELSAADHENEYIYYSLKNKNKIHLLEHSLKRWKEYPLYRPKRPERLHWMWDSLFLATTLNNDNIDIFHAQEITSCPTGILPKKCKTVITVHDMIPFIFWDRYKHAHTFDYRFALKRSLRLLSRADMIIAPSKATKNDILKFIDFPHESVKVIYEGVSQVFSPMDKLKAKEIMKKEYGMDGNYILYIGGADFRKNLHNLLLGYSRSLENHGIKHNLVLAGEVFERSHLNDVKTIQHLVQKLNIENHVKIPGFIPEHHLSCLYSGASLFIMPSLYEGFGLSVLESMACGTPVVTSSVSSLPEVCGNAAFLINPHDVEEISNAIDIVLNDMKTKNSLIQRGLEQARQFNWTKTARETLAVYKELAQRGQ
ncbi:MAG: glycosyltransferase family 4 protein [Candidatus Kuenenia sp.]|nr:glycosyltransferase family 4 protein [Candidatus Kuenenia hertensis]